MQVEWTKGYSFHILHLFSSSGDKSECEFKIDEDIYFNYDNNFEEKRMIILNNHENGSD